MQTKTFAALCSVLVALSTTGIVKAQDPSVVTPSDFPLTQKVLQVDIDNVGLADVARFIEKQAGVTTVVEPTLEETFLTMKMMDAPLLQLLNTIDQLLPSVSVLVSVGGSFLPLEKMKSVAPDRLAAFLQYKQGGKVVVMFKEKYEKRRGEQLAPSEDPDRMVTCVYSVSPILEETAWTIDDVATALDTAWKVRSGGKDGEATYHKETGLLICKGSMEAMQMADQVIGQMPAGQEVVILSLLFRREEAGDARFEERLTRTLKMNQITSRNEAALKQQIDNQAASIRALTQKVGSPLNEAAQ